MGEKFEGKKSPKDILKESERGLIEVKERAMTLLNDWILLRKEVEILIEKNKGDKKMKEELEEQLRNFDEEIMENLNIMGSMDLKAERYKQAGDLIKEAIKKVRGETE
ncbi:MAG: hypothetical protein HZB99_00040 [Candidatus Harrisonbacteria bacterium]|nr:hypothetical protein [Candidatus Harrisonbacteria bacterium]